MIKEFDPVNWLFEQIGEGKRSCDNGEPYACYQSGCLNVSIK